MIKKNNIQKNFGDTGFGVFFVYKTSYNIKNINIAQLLSICYNKSDKK